MIAALESLLYVVPETLTVWITCDDVGSFIWSVEPKQDKSGLFYNESAESIRISRKYTRNWQSGTKRKFPLSLY